VSPLPRLQLLEIHEQRWCPRPIRDGATDCLHTIAALTQQYRPVVPRLRHALQASGARRVVDLCSGGGGPWPSLYRHVAAPSLPILLTDLYPNLPAMQAAAGRSQHRIGYCATPVDVTHVPTALAGFRTLFTALHHFPPPRARAILQDAVAQQQGIAVFEQTRRSLLAVAVMGVLPLLALLIVPFIRPWRASRFFWTYIVPAIPLVLWFDGTVSCLRTYSPAELRSLVAGLAGPPYTWEIGWMPSPLSPIGVTYAIGYPTTGPRVARIR
jgi:hypothetical protein